MIADIPFETILSKIRRFLNTYLARNLPCEKNYDGGGCRLSHYLRIFCVK